MRRAAILVLVLVLAAACSSGGSEEAAPTTSTSSTTSTTPAPSELKGTLTITAPLANSSIAHTPDNTKCGVRLNGSATGLDDLADVTVKDRAGKLLADGRMPAGAVKLGGPPSLQTCEFHFTLTMYERPADVALFEFVWSRADVTVTESVPAEDVNAGAVLITATLA